MKQIKLLFPCFLLFFTPHSGHSISQDGYLIELDGTFSQDHEFYTASVSTSGKFELHTSTEERVKRSEAHDPAPYLFTGKITLRSPREVTVVGVNASFQYSEIKKDAPIENGGSSDNLESNLVKREVARPVRKVALFGQFKLGPETDQALNVLITFEVQELSHTVQGSNVLRTNMERNDFGFKGNLTAEKGDSKEILNFAMNLGFKDYKRVLNEGLWAQRLRQQNRTKREYEPTILKLNGELTSDSTSSAGLTRVIVTAFKGEATLDIVDASAPSPEDEFNAAGNDADQEMWETHGNITSKLGDITEFNSPVHASVRAYVPSQVKRDTEDDKVIELEYDGKFSAKNGRRRNPHDIGFTVKSKFWQISKTRTTISS